MTVTYREVLASLQERINIKCQLDFYLLAKKVYKHEINKAVLFTIASKIIKYL